MEASITIAKHRKKEIFYVSKNVNGVELWLNKKKALTKFKGERACVKNWQQAVHLLGQIMNNKIS